MIRTTTRTIEADGKDALPRKAMRQDPLYRIRVTVPAVDGDAWIWMRIAEELGLHTANGREIVFAPVRLNADQIARLNEDESAIRKRIREVYGTGIESIDFELVE